MKGCLVSVNLGVIMSDMRPCNSAKLTLVVHFLVLVLFQQDDFVAVDDIPERNRSFDKGRRRAEVRSRGVEGERAENWFDHASGSDEKTPTVL